MTTITQFLDKMHIGGDSSVDQARGRIPVAVSFRQISEVFWGIAAFVLFLLLGPFSAIAAICSVFSLAKQGNGVEPETIS